MKPICAHATQICKQWRLDLLCRGWWLLHEGVAFLSCCAIVCRSAVLHVSLGAHALAVFVAQGRLRKGQVMRCGIAGIEPCRGAEMLSIMSLPRLHLLLPYVSCIIDRPRSH